MQKDYETTMIKMKDYVPDKIDNLPIRLLLLLCKWKKRKGDQKMPSMRTDLLIRWNQTTHCNKVTLEDYLTTMTIIFESYKKMTKGKVLTMSMIETKLLGHHNIAIGGATAILHDNSIIGSKVLAEEAILAI